MVISACEQCGRNTVPEVRMPMELDAWLAEETQELKLNLHPRAPYSINTLPIPEHGVRLLIGPEGACRATRSPVPCRKISKRCCWGRGCCAPKQPP